MTLTYRLGHNFLDSRVSEISLTSVLDKGLRHVFDEMVWANWVCVPIDVVNEA